MMMMMMMMMMIIIIIIVIIIIIIITTLTLVLTGDVYIQNFLCKTFLIPYYSFKLNRLYHKMGKTTILPLFKVEMCNLVAYIFSFTYQSSDPSVLYSQKCSGADCCKCSFFIINDL